MGRMIFLGAKHSVQPQGGLPTFEQLTVPTNLQRKVFELLEVNLKP